jgi:hypothetical protein
VIPEKHPVPSGLLCGDGELDERSRIGELVERRQVEAAP